MGSRRRWLALGALGLAAVVAWVATRPTTRLVGVDKVISEETLPLWIKALNFIDRDANFDQAARAVLAGAETDEARAMVAFAWTRQNIRPQPPSLRSRDDHVWHVVVRGYGEADQQADVFTTILVYGGVPAYWTLVGTKPDELPVSYALVDGAWRVFDVAHGVVFRRRDGALATPDDLARDPGVVAAAAAAVDSAVDYPAYFVGYVPPEAPDVLRADLQMPVRRLVHEMRALVGLEGRVWRIRPHETSPGEAARLGQPGR